MAPCNLVACMRTGQTVLLTEGRRWSIWLPLLLQSFKHDAVLDAESEIGASTMLVAFWVVCGLTILLSGYHQIHTTKKNPAPCRQFRILMWPETIIFFVWPYVPKYQINVSWHPKASTAKGVSKREICRLLIMACRRWFVLLLYVLNRFLSVMLKSVCFEHYGKNRKPPSVSNCRNTIVY